MSSCIYIHIPFCVRKCLYCDFLSIPYSADAAGKYITALSNELQLRKNIAHAVKTVYIGGGTPTILSPLEMIRLLESLRDAFNISPDAELTIEVNPGTIDKEKTDLLLAAGINRFSVGIQSFNDRELGLLERIHSAAEGIRANDLLKGCGVKNLSIDLLYGIPGQTLKDWDCTLSKAMELLPEHVSVYELTPEKGTPLHRAIVQGKLKKPEEDTIIEMYYHAIDTLSDAGYRHYEISNFARAGFESRHNTNYWDRGEYLGLGAGAHSFIKGRRIKNTGDIKVYINALNKDRLAIEEESEVSCADAIKEHIFLGLRKKRGLDIKRFREELGIDLLDVSEDLICGSLLEQDNGYLRLTRKGIVISNPVIIKLFEGLGLD